MEGHAEFDRWFALSIDMLCIAGFDGYFKRLNPAWTRTLGWTIEELLARPYLEFVHPDDRPATIAEAEKLAMGGVTITFENRYIRKDGSYQWIQWNASPFVEEQLIYAVARDISEHKKMEEALREAHEELEVRVQERTLALAKANEGLRAEIVERRRAEEALRLKTEQLQVISEAMTKFLVNGDWREASAQVLRGALRQTASEYGFIGVVADGPVLRILAHEGIVWNATMNREFYENALRTYQEKGYLEFTSFDNLFGKVITTGAVVLSNDPNTDPRSRGLPPGHPPLRHFLGVPIVQGTKVVGMIGVANRPGGYTGAEQAKLEILTQAVGVLYDSYVRREREAKLEAQLRQAQKMEAIGRLAGGVAHDFNNLLMIINGYSGLILQQQYGTEERLQGSVLQIKQAGERAITLVQQLLAFSRKQVLVPTVVDLNAVIMGMSTMLQRLLGEDVDLAIDLDQAIGHVKADPSQLEQVVMNLAINARDAMPQGGRLTIETRNRDITETNRHGQIVRLGRYVTLSVSDTGCGMDQETQARIFEPFFTTKEQGRGTGLGLSTVYGIVKQSGGYAFVYSELGRGSTFRIYLPRVDEAVETDTRPPVEQVPATGTETILLVEDEPGVRALIRDTLVRHGYAVHEARHGVEALLAANQESAPIHLLLTDVIMPQMSGRELAERLMPMRPGMKVLYMSGHSDAAVVHHGVIDPGTTFLQKPFEAAVLLRTVREVLDSPRKP